MVLTTQVTAVGTQNEKKSQTLKVKALAREACLEQKKDKVLHDIISCRYV